MARGKNRGQWFHTAPIAASLSGKWLEFPGDETQTIEREVITDPKRASEILGALAEQKVG